MDQVERLLQKPACLIDLFPRQVPREGCSRFSKVEYHYLSQFAAYGLDRRYAGVLLKVSAQYPTVLGWDGWTENPAPDQLAEAVHTVMENHSGWVHLLLPEEDALLFLSGTAFRWRCTTQGRSWGGSWRRLPGRRDFSGGQRKKGPLLNHNGKTPGKQQACRGFWFGEKRGEGGRTSQPPSKKGKGQLTGKRGSPSLPS